MVRGRDAVSEAAFSYGVKRDIMHDEFWDPYAKEQCGKIAEMPGNSGSKRNVKS